MLSVGAGASLLAGCSPSLGGLGREGVSANGLVDPAIVELEWRRIEASREALIRGPKLRLDDVLDDARSRGRTSRGDALAKKAANTLFLTGAFRDLPETSRVHPSVQHTMVSSMPDIDDAVLGMKSRLDALTPTERADLSKELRKDPELAERVVALLDVEAERVGASDVRRIHLRRVGLAVCERLHQSSDHLIGEYSTKLDKIVERHGSDVEIERRLATAMGETAFQAMRERTLLASESYRSVEVAGAQRISGSGNGRAKTDDEWSSTKVNVLVAGAVFMGLATIMGVAGAIVVAGGSFAGAFVLTAGGVFLLTGLILLIIGAAIS